MLLISVPTLWYVSNRSHKQPRPPFPDPFVLCIFDQMCRCMVTIARRCRDKHEVVMIMIDKAVSFCAERIMAHATRKGSSFAVS
jgi:hypothetical protein